MHDSLPDELLQVLQFGRRYFGVPSMLNNIPERNKICWCCQ